VSFPLARVPRVRTGAALAAAIACAGIISACSNDDSTASKQPSTEPLLVAAASDLRPAFAELGKLFEAQTGTSVTFTFGASGQLAQQLENGAPYALFASASLDYVDRVLDAGRGDRATRAVYAYGRLAVWSPQRRYSLADLQGSTVKTIAVADPDHAPYGKAAVQTLRSSGLYARVKPKLVFGDNVAATQELAASGNADVAIIARSLAQASAGTFTPVPSRLHAPLAQALLVTADGVAGARARAFKKLVLSPEGQSVLRRDGFILPASHASTTPAA
jgi:molybdate transport system substrate-binding protein